MYIFPPLASVPCNYLCWHLVCACCLLLEQPKLYWAAQYKHHPQSYTLWRHMKHKYRCSSTGVVQLRNAGQPAWELSLTSHPGVKIKLGRSVLVFSGSPFSSLPVPHMRLCVLSEDCSDCMAKLFFCSYWNISRCAVYKEECSKLRGREIFYWETLTITGIYALFISICFFLWSTTNVGCVCKIFEIILTVPLCSFECGSLFSFFSQLFQDWQLRQTVPFRKK